MDSLADQLKAMVTDEYVFFLRGPLSQWVTSPFYQNEVRFTCCEQYMMWRKAILFKDNDIAEKILLSKSPKEQKDLGREVKNYQDTVWRQYREKVVFQGNFLKFSQLSSFRDLLFSTGDRILVEVNPRDTIWGIGLRDTDPDIHFPDKWKGLNLLGQALMRVRLVLKSVEDTYFE